MTGRTKKIAFLTAKLMFWRVVLCLSTLGLLLSIVLLAFEMTLLEHLSVKIMLLLEFLSVCFSGNMQGFLVEAMTPKKRPF